MVAITNTTSLTFLKEAIDSTLSEAETALESFSEDGAGGEALMQCQQAFLQLRGICKMVELPAAGLMSEEMALAAKDLQEKPSQPLTEALSSAIVLLGRYFDYVQLKNDTMPVLLIGGINALRRANRKPLIQESHFFSVDLSRPRQPAAERAQVSAAEFSSLVRRLRHMYQVGLLGILKGENPAPHLKLMYRALSRLDSACGPCKQSRFWWLSRAALQGMAEDKMVLSSSRKALLGQIDRQIKRVVYDGQAALSTEAPLLLVKECLYLISLSSRERGVVAEVKQVFNLYGHYSDEQLQQELALMSGSRSSVIRSVATALREELGDLKDTLDLASQGVADTDYEAVAEALERIASAFAMIGQDSATDMLRQWAKKVRPWPVDLDAESEQFQSLVDQLLATENVLAELEHSLTPSDDLRSAANNSGISLYQLDDARMSVVTECRSGLSLAKRSLTAFMEHNWDPMHLSNLPGTFSSIAGGLMFLDLHRASAITRSCHRFIQQRLINGDATPTQEAMETLADALTGIDYYLESMEEHKPIGDGVLDVAEHSVAALGCPVERAAVA